MTLRISTSMLNYCDTDTANFLNFLNHFLPKRLSSQFSFEGYKGKYNQSRGSNPILSFRLRFETELLVIKIVL